ncbi:type VII secretion-associated serine protease mycosin [Streptomyces sp. QHH-9511]|uniref:type VII secretion-associated serine protease mycosin n=1 Tax=Streptomyces sp. QHH-9511 TaxID=2684468 RepID=UPI001E51CD77|nr:type VII secretion-associated serine protease mycosin [Streptomyces sp. QHH-9511]
MEKRMWNSSGRAIGSGSLVAATMSLALLGLGATPAHAETVRDRQWHLDVMKADEMWKISKGAGITVAVIDSGVDDSVADLRGQVLPGKDYSRWSGDENKDIAVHGTGMAALIAATGARGAAQGSYGLAPGVKILPIRIPYGGERWEVNGTDETFAQSMAKAIRFAADSNAKIINISVGNSKDGPELAEAVKYALGKNKLIFAAVGNSADAGNEVEYPAATPGVVGIGGVSKKAAWWPKSQTGPQVDLAAPAENITNACTGGTQLCEGDGTSAATALASASAALIWAKHPNWTNNQVLRVMLNTAGKPKSGDERTDLVGYGAVRPRVALTNPGDPGPAGAYPLPDLAAAEKAASPSASASSVPSSAPSEKPATAAPGPAASDSDNNSGPWNALGVGAAVLIGGAVAAVVLRARRRSAMPPVPGMPPAMPPYAPYGSPQQQAPNPYPRHNTRYGPPPGPGQPG